MGTKLPHVSNQEPATPAVAGTAASPILAPPTLPQASPHGILDLVNIGTDGVKVRVDYNGRRDGDTITARFGASRQVKVVDGSNLDYPAYDVKFPVADIPVGSYEVGYNVESIMGNITPAGTLAVDVINTGEPHGNGGGEVIYWKATSGAPNLPTPASYATCNLVTLQGDPDQVLVISEVSAGVKLGSGIVPRPASAPVAEVKLDELGRATVWVTRCSPEMGGRASFTLTDRANASKRAVVDVTFGVWKPAQTVPFEIAYTSGASADGVTPCAIYLRNVSAETRQVTLYCRDGWVDITDFSLTLEPGGIQEVQVTSVIRTLTTIEIKSGGVPFPPVSLDFIPLNRPQT